MAGEAKTSRLSAAPPRRRPPTTRDRRSRGAAVARDFVKIPPPVKLVIEMVAGGGSELQRPRKELREGDLSARFNPFELLLPFGDAEAEDIAEDLHLQAADLHIHADDIHGDEDEGEGEDVQEEVAAADDDDDEVAADPAEEAP